MAITIVDDRAELMARGTDGVLAEGSFEID
jgi:hypothetical protein